MHRFTSYMLIRSMMPSCNAKTNKQAKIFYLFINIFFMRTKFSQDQSRHIENPVNKVEPLSHSGWRYALVILNCEGEHCLHWCRLLLRIVSNKFRILDRSSEILHPTVEHGITQFEHAIQSNKMHIPINTWVKQKIVFTFNVTCTVIWSMMKFELLFFLPDWRLRRCP